MKDSFTGLVSVSLVGGIIGRALEYMVHLVLARSLGAEAVGLFSFGFVILSLSTTISKLGLDKAARKFVPIHVDDDSELSGVLLVCLGGAFVTGCLVSFVIYLGSGLLDQLTSESFSSVTTLFLLGIPLMGVMSVGRAATTGFLTTKYAVYIKDIGQSGTAIGLVLVAGFMIGTIESAVIAYVVSLGVGSALAVYFLVRQGGFNAMSRTNLPVREVFVYSIPLTLAAAAQYLISWTDILMLGAFEQPDAVGVYQVSYQSAMMLGFVMVAVSSIFPAIVSDLYNSGEHERLGDMFSALTKWVTYVAAFGYVFFLLYAQDVLAVFGPEFADGRLLLLIVGLGVAISTAVGPAGFLLMMTEYERLEMVNTAIVSILNIGLNFVLIQEYGVLGAAIATGFSTGILNLLRLAESWLLLGIRPKVRRYWKGAIGIAVAGGTMYAGTGLALSNIPRLILVGGLSFGVFAAVLYLFGLDPEDRLLLQSI